MPKETLSVATCHIGRCLIHPLLHQRDDAFHAHQAFRMQLGHQPKLTSCLQSCLLQPTFLQSQVTQLLGAFITMEGSRFISPDLTRKLIQKQHQPQGRFGMVFPVLETARLCCFGQGSETTTQMRITCIVPAEPLPGFALDEPEVEDLCGLFPVVSWHHAHV